MSFNVENIVTYFNNDLALRNADGDSLRSFAKNNPYSGVLQLLYCKYLKLNNDVAFESQLEKCSLVVADRKKVYELLFQADVQEKIIEHETAFNENSKTLETKPENTIITEEKEIKKEGSDEKLVLPLVNEPSKKEEIKETFTVSKKVIDELEENILVEAVNSSIQLDVSKYESSADEDNLESEKIEEKINLEEDSGERIFVNWFEKPKTAPKRKNKESKTSIIDDFLKTTSRSRKNEPKNKEKIFSPTNIAKMSLVANNEFVTETLANIYARQGQIVKAIEIYKQLSLKYPEKKTFFASRIRFLKEKQKYNN